MNDRTTAARGHYWTTVEIAVLREHYARPGGPALVAELLPHRGLHAVYAQARNLGLQTVPGGSTGKRFARKWPNTPDIDRAITAGYTHMRQRGDVKSLAAQVGRPKWWVCHRAVTLGLTKVRIKEQPWTRAELALLDEHASCVVQTIRAKLAAAGHTRTATAIAVQIKRLRIDRTDPDAWTARDLGALLGVDGNTVADWVARRGLKAERRPWGPNGVFRITRGALRAWLREHHGYVDLRKVDQPWFYGVVL